MNSKLSEKTIKNVDSKKESSEKQTTQESAIKPRISRKKLKIAAIIFAAIFVLALVAVVFLLNRSPRTNINNDTKHKLQQLLLDGQGSKIKKIESKYGFTIRYDSSSLTASAHAVKADSSDQRYSAETFKEDQLSESRGYNLVELSFKEPKDKPKKTGRELDRQALNPHIVINTSRVDKYFDRTKIPEKFKDTKKYSDLDIMAEAKIIQLKKNSPDAKYKVTNLTVNGKKFKKLDEKTVYKLDGKTYETNGHIYTYMTVQSGRPYWMTITAPGSAEADKLRQLEAIIADIKFSAPDKKLLVFENSNETATAVLANSDGQQSPQDKDSVNTLEEIDASSLIDVVARNQIASVRVGALRCADLVLKAANGASAQLNGLCAGGIGSGSIASSDGYIVTNGHVTEISDRSLLKYLPNDTAWANFYGFLINAGYISRAELGNLIDKAVAGDKKAAEVIYAFMDKIPDSSISVVRSNYSYAIQTSNEPIRFNESRTGWNLSSTNLEAKKIDYEVDMRRDSLDLDSPKTDVAILKINGNFPAVEIGDSSAISTSSKVTTIGYPAVVDGGVNTKKATTVPTVTQGYISRIMRDGGGHKLFAMSAKIASGNSGGPAFDSRGKQIGINTYGGAECEGEEGNSCFGRGIARDIKDFQDMARRNNIEINPNGELTRLWKSGLNEFSAGRYSKAKEYFKQFNDKYPNNYLGQKMLKLAESTPDESRSHGGSNDRLPDDDLSEGSLDNYGGSGLDGENNTAVVIVVLATLFIFGGLFVGVIVALIHTSKQSKRLDRQQQMMAMGNASGRYGSNLPPRSPYDYGAANYSAPPTPPSSQPASPPTPSQTSPMPVQSPPPMPAWPNTQPGPSNQAPYVPQNPPTPPSGPVAPPQNPPYQSGNNTPPNWPPQN